jgi:putative ABC transport system permease protein
VLLVGAGLLVRSYVGLERVSPGFDPARAMTASVLIPVGGTFDPQRDGPRWAAFFGEYVERLAAQPGVAAVGGASALPLSGGMEFTTFSVEGRTYPDDYQPPGTGYVVATPGYFRAAAIPLLAGRTFDAGDRRDSDPVVIVSAALAREAFPGEPVAAAIGRRLRTGLNPSQRIVGVAGDVRQIGLDIPAGPTVYLAQSQYPYPSLTIVARVRDGEPVAALPAMRRELRAMDPAMALDHVRPLQEVLDASISRQRFGMLVTGGFAVAALFLAMVGLYGVIAYGVAQRTREIGVRMALGATRRDVLVSVVGEGMVVVGVGVAVGLAAALAAARLLRGQLYEVSVTDAGIYVAVVVVTSTVALVASAIPARRATRLDPVRALRVE